MAHGLVGQSGAEGGIGSHGGENEVVTFTIGQVQRKPVQANSHRKCPIVILNDGGLRIDVIDLKGPEQQVGLKLHILMDSKGDRSQTYSEFVCMERVARLAESICRDRPAGEALLGGCASGRKRDDSRTQHDRV